MSRQRTWNGQVARELRDERGLSPDQVAESIGLHRATVYAMEAGRAPQMRHAVLLADLYEVPLDVFFVTQRASSASKKPGARNGNGPPAELAKS